MFGFFFLLSVWIFFFFVLFMGYSILELLYRSNPDQTLKTLRFVFGPQRMCGIHTRGYMRYKNRKFSIQQVKFEMILVHCFRCLFSQQLIYKLKYAECTPGLHSL